MSISLTSYPHLNAYAVLAGAQITNSGATTIVNGNLGSFGGANVGGITFTNGSFDNTGNATTSQTELTALVNVLAAISPTTTITNTTIGTGQAVTSVTFTSGSYVTGGALTLLSGGSLIFNAQNNPSAQFYIEAAGGIVFTNGTLSLINGAQAGNIFFVSGSSITNAIAMTLYGVFIAQSTITLATNTNVVGRLYAQTAAITFLANNVTVASVNNNNTVCFLKGTHILTKTGYKPIEHIKIGDSIYAKGKIMDNETYNIKATPQFKRVKWMGKFVATEMNTETMPICFKKDCFSPNIPNQDLYVSPNHGIMWNGNKIPAHKFLSMSLPAIFQASNIDHIEYYHLELDEHSIIVANGTATESYLEINENRKAFKDTTSFQPHPLQKLSFPKKNKRKISP